MNDAPGGPGAERDAGTSEQRVAEFYAAMAPDYDAEFDVPHRRAYDRLAWDAVQDLLGAGPARIVDVGSGTGRWARRLVEAGHAVVGIEPCAAMAAGAADIRSDRFTLHPCGVDDADLSAGHADAVLAMGSLQYSRDPAASIARAARWLRPGGVMVVLVDSLGSLVLELLRRGDRAQALERMSTRRARWQRNGLTVEHHLFDAASLRGALDRAGLVGVGVTGLLVSAAVLPKEQLHLDGDDLLVEAALGRDPALVDAAKQLLGIGFAPA